MPIHALLVFDTMDLPEANVLLRIQPSDVQIDVLCNTGGIHHRLLEDTQISVEPLLCRSRLDFKAVRVVRDKLHKKHYDLIHAFTSRALSVCLLATVGMETRPKIVAYRGAIGNVHPLDITTRLTFHNPKLDKISCVSDAVLSYLASCGIADDKLVRIYKGHEIEWYERAPRSALAAFGIPADAFVVACVANMRPNKGVDVLLRAADVIGPNNNIHYLLMGEVRDRKLGEMARNSRVAPQLHFLGWRRDASSLVGAADILALPTRFSEGLPKAVIEAMAQGIPPVASRVGGVPELVEDNINGLIVEPSDPKALAEKILRLHEDVELRHSLGQAAVERIRNEFSVERTVEQTLALYRELVPEPVLQAAQG